MCIYMCRYIIYKYVHMFIHISICFFIEHIDVCILIFAIARFPLPAFGHRPSFVGKWRSRSADTERPHEFSQRAPVWVLQNTGPAGPF